MSQYQRAVCWFSAGAASAVATKIVLSEWAGLFPEIVVVYTDVGSEHPDNERFIQDCERWFDHPVQRIKSERYADTWQVWEERRFLVGPKGALCTAELKKRPRFAFQHADDYQVFGYTADPADAARADRFRAQNPDVALGTPLIDRGLTKDDCLAVIDRAGIVLPAMYQLGYRNNNCVGCVKGGMGYWNKIRRDFPETFDRMAALERTLGATILRDKDGAVWLDELDPGRGRYEDELAVECSLLCADVSAELGT